MHKPPYLRLSTFYFFFFAALGIFSPYWPVYLKENLAYSPIEIGQVLSAFMISRLVGPILFSSLADKTSHRINVIRLGSFAAVVTLSGIFINDTFWWVLLISFLFGIFWNAVLPQYEAFTLNQLGEQSKRYSLIRVWGSIGFMLVVIAFPRVMETATYVPHTIIVLLVLMTLSCFLVNDEAVIESQSIKGATVLWDILKKPVVIAILLAGLLQSANHGAYYTFFTIYLIENNYSASFSGVMWAFGVLIEIFLFLVIHRLLNRFNLSLLFALSLLLTAIRWLLMAYFVNHVMMLWFIQALHAASFGLFHVSMMHLIHHFFPAQFQGRGQALYSGLSYGLGGAIGSSMSGYLWYHSGSTITFLAMSGLALVAWLIALIFIRNISENTVKQT
ncbi:MAG: Nucleoside:H+ symporter:Major facilitator superfamily [uncultured Thiotrichaceae bacterium]|uniref:Nucleoside:H+ symporter:Major facilitator superfamily n=1 Tax=uncultured Thiotrichaceae bacterium TaxID=298394 RepID=A0A6S6U5G1_9GAMM|nr:MAG: Nucleoside:H+ symporter:Major facilitator superfamily [uncultured Thiotrichaceae bacterium]